MSWIIAVAVLELAWAIAVVNRLVSRRQDVREAWSGVLAQLQRRTDAIEPLVAVVEAARDHDALQVAITELRAAVSDEASVARIDEAAEAFASSWLVVERSEAWPELLARHGFRALAQELVEVEDDLQGARMLYNHAVLRFNVACDSWPALLVARSLGQRPARYFESADLRVRRT